MDNIYFLSCYNKTMMKGMRAVKPEPMDKMMAERPSKGEAKKVYPHFRIDLKHLPEAKKWEVGNKYLVTLEMEQTGISMSEYDNSASFDIYGIKAHSNGEKPKRYTEGDKERA